MFFITAPGAWACPDRAQRVRGFKWRGPTTGEVPFKPQGLVMDGDWWSLSSEKPADERYHRGVEAEEQSREPQRSCLPVKLCENRHTQEFSSLDLAPLVVPNKTRVCRFSKVSDVTIRQKKTKFDIMLPAWHLPDCLNTPQQGPRRQYS